MGRVKDFWNGFTQMVSMSKVWQIVGNMNIGFAWGSMLNKLLAALTILLLLFGAHLYDKQQAVYRAVEAATGKMAMEYQRRSIEASKVALKAQESLQQEADKEREKKDETIRNISDDLQRALVRLRNRPERPSTPTAPQDSDVGQACTARELYREDAEFLTREAARAQSVLAERNYYYSQYEIIRKKQNGIDFTN